MHGQMRSERAGARRHAIRWRTVCDAARFLERRRSGRFGRTAPTTTSPKLSSLPASVGT